MAPLVRASAFALAAALALTSCSRRVPSPTEALERAAAAAGQGSATPRQLALAGFHAWLLESSASKAQTFFDQAVERDGAEPYALAGQLLMARRRAHPERALVAALDLCERAPTHPLAAMGGRFVLDMAGASTALDELILRRGEAALGAGLAGDAAYLLRSAMATIRANRGDDQAHAELLAAMGAPTAYTLLGPFSPFHRLSFDEATPPERTGSVVGPWQGPYGEVRPRVLRFPDASFSLAGEAPGGDGYLLAVDLEVAEEAVHVIRTVTSAPHKAYLDGTLLFERRSFERPASTVAARGVLLTPGRHRLVVRLSKEERTATFWVGALRADGRPARLGLSAASGPAPAWGGVATVEVPLVYPEARHFFEALRDEAGGLLAGFLALRDGMGRDRDGAKRLAATLSTLTQSPALSGARAELALGDRTVPPKVARGRATRDLESTLERDKGDLHTLLLSAGLALEDGRHLDAAELVKLARAAHSPPGYPVVLAQARVELALGVDAQADQSALEAAQLQPGLCDALSLRYDVARRRDAVALADGLLEALAQCPGALSRAAEHARSRGALAAAAESYEKLLSRDPLDVGGATSLAAVYVSLRRFDEAARLLSELRRHWPRNTLLPKRLAEVYDFAGKPAEAQRAREEALALDGGDLQLLRIVERARTGAEPLQEHAVSAKEAIAAYEASPGGEDTVSACVLDSAVVRAHPDGSTVDRIHIIQKALDPSGVSEVAEVSIPQGAHLLALRTRKADGTVLEPESIEGKDSVSLPGVQVGDYIEYEYLQANSPRGPAQPGFTGPSFYFQISRQPNHWSRYKVIAPKGAGLSVDAHNMKAPLPEVKGEVEVFFHEERRVPPYIPEPSGPPSSNEYLPFVTVGAGATGNEGVIAVYADAYLDRGAVTFEVEELARAATAGKEGLEAVRALYAAVHEKLQDRDAGLSVSAAASISQDRGSRLWALKAGLEALGIRARVAAVRTFATDPKDYRFPSEALLPYVCLRVELPGGEQVWLDPLVRFAPFGELPEQAMGREAYLFPEPGRPLERVKTPPRAERPGKKVTLELELHPDGKLTGSGEEVYTGFEAAQLAEALEAVSPDQRDQALQSALSRYFGGAELSKLELDLRRAVGATLSVRYRFTAPSFARVEGKKLVLPPLTFPAQLGRRFVQLGTRRTPLYIDSTEASATRATLVLPRGFRLSEAAAELESSSPFGRFVRRERVDGQKLLIEEDFRLSMARVPVEQYDAFARFAGEVDLIQARDLVVQPEK